ncbi:MAG: thymidine phosphorylase [bacterium]|nr:thymidine phosphorylase [bacterium]
MNMVDIITKKKDKQILTDVEIEYVINGYVDGTIPDYQMSALLMAICLNDLTIDEIYSFVKYMVASGSTIDFSSLGKVVDKHSTGGVGDKTSLIVCPLVASCGVNVAKMSGRSLGKTGGTIDKLESIAGYDVNMSIDKIKDQVKKIHIALVTCSDDLVLADKKIYALRDATGTVDNIGLIASSIMSKKIASGSTNIVVDVKVGRGAFMKTQADGKRLAQQMIQIGKKYDKKVVALITNMDVPLGLNIGNSLEVMEAMDVLQNKGEENLTKLCVELASWMVSLGLNVNIDKARQVVKEKLLSGEAYSKFLTWIKAQGGDINNLKTSKYKYEVTSKINGYIFDINAYMMSEVISIIGGSREKKGGFIDLGCGIIINKKINDYVKTNDVLATIYSNKVIDNFDIVRNAFTISSKKQVSNTLIYDIVK